MNDRLVFALTFVAALGSGVVGGAFFAFSSFVMKALARLPAPHGVAAMQSVNVAVINAWFLLPFLGTAGICLVLALSSVIEWHTPGAGHALVGSLLYLLGTFLVTLAFNVPRNNRLAAVDPASAEGADYWHDYLRSWTSWNHVRTVTALAASAAFIAAL